MLSKVTTKDNFLFSEGKTNPFTIPIDDFVIARKNSKKGLMMMSFLLMISY